MTPATPDPSPSAPPSPEAARAAARRSLRWIVFLASATLSLSVAAGWLALRVFRAQRPYDLQSAIGDPEIHDAIVDRLVARSKGIFDTHPDPDVGRVLQPDLEAVRFAGAPVNSNEWGLREVSFRMPKPPGVVRVVLLGDSYVFGFGVNARERTGVFLEDYLASRSQDFAGTVEVLHLAIGSWNAVAECEFARRLLSDLQPDLLVQVLVTNDLDDNPGVRGFGARASFTPRYPERTDAMVHMTYPVQFTGKGNVNFLLEGVDWESRGRYEELAQHVERLARAVEAGGGRYLLAAHWPTYKPKLKRVIDGRLGGDQVLWLPDAFQRNKNLWVGPADPHWNGAGHRLLAEVLWGVAKSRDLLPVLNLRSWPEVESKAEQLVDTGFREAHEERPEAFWGSRRPVASRASFQPATDESLRQVYTGVDDEGLVSPYASVLLKGPAQALRVRGRCLDRPELDGVRVEVFADEVPVGEFELRAGLRIDHTLPLPESVRGREFVCARFVSPDWVYAGHRKRHCVSFAIEELALTQ